MLPQAHKWKAAERNMEREKPPLKAWLIDCKYNDYEDYCLFVHAETRGKAKYRAKVVDPGTAYLDMDWVDIRATRVPALDGKPFTLSNVQSEGYWLEFEGEPITRLATIECDCEICKIALSRASYCGDLAIGLDISDI